MPPNASRPAQRVGGTDVRFGWCEQRRGVGREQSVPGLVAYVLSLSSYDANYGRILGDNHSGKKLLFQRSDTAAKEELRRPCACGRTIVVGNGAIYSTKVRRRSDR
jgi:hypothetical protein